MPCYQTQRSQEAAEPTTQGTNTKWVTCAKRNTRGFDVKGYNFFVKNDKR